MILFIIHNSFKTSLQRHMNTCTYKNMVCLAVFDWLSIIDIHWSVSELKNVVLLATVCGGVIVIKLIQQSDFTILLYV